MKEFKEKKEKIFPAGKKGFSLIELLLVIFILTMTIGITLVSYRDASQVDKVEAAARKIAVAIREAQNNALTGRQVEIASKGALEPACAHGVEVNGTLEEIKPFFKRKSGAACATAEYYDGKKLTFSSAREDIDISPTSASIEFSIPSGKVVSGAQLITITSRTNSSIRAYVCTYSSGNIREIFDSTVPTCN